jgi:hypothetical protein
VEIRLRGEWGSTEREWGSTEREWGSTEREWGSTERGVGRKKLKASFYKKDTLKEIMTWN